MNAPLPAPFCAPEMQASIRSTWWRRISRTWSATWRQWPYGVLAVMLALLIGAMQEKDAAIRERDDANLMQRSSSIRDEWQCEVLRGDRYAVCELPPNAARVLDLLAVHTGCCQ